MPYKDKDTERMKANERKRRQRSMSRPVTPAMSHPVTPITDVKPSDDYPTIIHWLADDTKRAKLRAISNTLSNRNVSEHVRFGVNGLTFDTIGELLTAFPVSSKLGKAKA